VIYWEKLRTELGRYADGVHEVGPPATRAALENAALPPSLAELYRSFDGVRLFTDSFVLHPLAALRKRKGVIELGEALGTPLHLDESGKLYQLDEEGDPLLVGSSLPRYLDSVLAREKLVVDREGEYKDVFVEGGELNDQIRLKRARVGLKIDPDSAAYHLEAAELAFEAGDEAEAQAELERAVAADAQAGAAWMLLGGLHERARRAHEAAEAFARAAASTSDPARRAERWAEAARVAGGDTRAKLAARSRDADAAAAARWLEEARRRMDEGDPDAALRLGQLAEAVGEVDAELLKRARLKTQLKVF
jgi:tetratricopeptide (TPR) repeat protein